jgi:D-glycero-alpha-D-manno-heptose-7-phosphate kinase
MRISSRAPVRISFGGGGTDVSPFCEEHGGVALNVGVTKYAYSTLEPADRWEFRNASYGEVGTFGSVSEFAFTGPTALLEAVAAHFCDDRQKYRVWLDVEVEPGSGLGSSASAFAACIGVFNHLLRERRLSDYEVAELAYHLERHKLHVAGGRQDQYAAVFGGINFLEFRGNDFVRVNPIRLGSASLCELERDLLLVNIGKRRDSGHIIEKQTADYKSGKNVEALLRTKALAGEMRYALLREEFGRFGALLDEAWQAKKAFTAEISDRWIDDVYDAARAGGAVGGKVCGAGGGGHMVFYCPGPAKRAVSRRIEQMGYAVVPFVFDMRGLTTWETEK